MTSDNILGGLKFRLKSNTLEEIVRTLSARRAEYAVFADPVRVVAIRTSSAAMKRRMKQQSGAFLGVYRFPDGERALREDLSGLAF